MRTTTGPQTHSSFYSPLKTIILLCISVLGLYIISTNHYLIYHTFVESLRIVVVMQFSFVVWRRRHDIHNDYLLIIGLTLPIEAVLIVLHILSFKGMNVFSGFNADLPTQLWIAERYLFSLAFLIAPYFLWRQRQTRKHLNPDAILAMVSVITVLVLVSLFYWHNFPSCYVEGRGLTLFKIFSEYLIIISIFVSIALLESQRQRFDPNILRWLILFLFFNAIADLTFTTYISVYGLANFLGHISLLTSLYFLFRITLQIKKNQNPLFFPP